MGSDGIDLPDARSILTDYVSRGKLVQVATIDGVSNPALCHVWYDFGFSPDRLVFMSRPTRDHSRNINQNSHVAGGIVWIELESLGQKVQGVTFKGIARELDPAGNPAEVESFVKRWPAAEPGLIEGGPSRLYEIAVTEWTLFDEVNFPDEPRQVINPGS